MRSGVSSAAGAGSRGVSVGSKVSSGPGTGRRRGRPAGVSSRSSTGAGDRLAATASSTGADACATNASTSAGGAGGTGGAATGGDAGDSTTTGGTGGGATTGSERTGTGTGGAGACRTLAGNATSATTPGAPARSSTLTPTRAARCATTNRPSERDSASRGAGGSASNALAAASRSSAMPIPWSVIDSTYVVPYHVPPTTTRDSGGENDVAFSSSSARRCVRSMTAAPTTFTPSSPCTSTRA